MDVEHTKAKLADVRVVLAPSRVSLAVPTASPMDAARQALNIATALVAAVERVQAIAEHWSTCPKGDYDCHDCNYNRPKAGDLLLEALKLETP